MRMTIIKNYGMPHNCYDCDLHNYHECDLTGESIEDDYCWNGDSREKHCPLREVEAIPKDQIKKFLEEGTKDDGNNVLAIVREDYIHKSDYKNRLKADLVAMLEEIDLQFDEICFCRKSEWKTVPEIKAEYKAVIRQKIDALKEKIT